jgi:hypothetical protein
MEWSFDDYNFNGQKTHHTLKNSMVPNFWDVPKLLDYETLYVIFLQVKTFIL